MPNSSEQQNSSDDLIAELARLMAEEAQGSRPVGSDAPAVNAPNSADRAPSQDSANIVRIPGTQGQARREPVLSAPGKPTTDSAWGRTRENAPPSANVGTLSQPDTLGTEKSTGGANREGNTQGRSDMPARGEPFEAHAVETEGRATHADASKQYDFAADDADFLANLAMPATVGDASGTPGPRNSAPMSDTDRQQKATPDGAQLSHQADDPIAALIADQHRHEAEEARQTAEKQRLEAQARAAAARESERIAALAARAQAERQEVEKLRRQADERARAAAVAEAASRTVTDLEATRPAKVDRFDAAPIFGLGGAQKAKPQSGGGNPLDEIESLIGDAVRLGREPDRAPRKAAMPADTADLEDAAIVAEAAIAAASVETRTRREASAAPKGTESGFVAVEPKFPQGSTARSGAGNRRIVASAAAATVLVAVGLGLYWVFGMQGVTNGTIPFLASNTQNAKTVAAAPATTPEANQSVIFNELQGNTPPTSSEQIVPRDQSATLPDNGVRQIAGADVTTSALANRKVRTVTVRPDGTIVTGDESVAANEILPINRPNVPKLTDSTAAQTDFQVSSTPTAGATSQTPAAGTQPTDPVAAILAGQAASDTAGTNAAQTQTALASAAPTSQAVAGEPVPIPMPRLTNRQALAASIPQVATVPVKAATPANSAATVDLIAGIANQVATQAPAAATAPTLAAASAPSDGVTAPAYVQLSSQRSQEAANATLAVMQNRYQSLFGGSSAFVRQIDLADRGTFFRVLIPAKSQNDATTICANIRSAGGDCFVRNN